MIWSLYDFWNIYSVWFGAFLLALADPSCRYACKSDKVTEGCLISVRCLLWPGQWHSSLGCHTVQWRWFCVVLNPGWFKKEKKKEKKTRKTFKNVTVIKKWGNDMQSFPSTFFLPGTVVIPGWLSPFFLLCIYFPFEQSCACEWHASLCGPALDHTCAARSQRICRGHSVSSSTESLQDSSEQCVSPIWTPMCL